MTRFAHAICAIVIVTSCSGSESTRSATPWRTVFDSTGDTIVARTTGDVPNELIRGLVLEHQIGEADGNDTVTFGQIASIAVTRDGHIFVFDLQGPSLKLFASSGQFVRYVGHKGGGPGEFEQVNGMNVMPNGGLALWDASHSRVNVYSAAGDFRAQWRVPISGMFDWNGFHTDREKTIVLRGPMTHFAVFGEHAFLRFDSAGTLLDTVRIPRWVDSTPQLTASAGNPPQVRQTMPLPFAPQLTYTWSWAGSLISGSSSHYEIYATRKGTKPLKVIGPGERVPVLPAEADFWREWSTWVMRYSFPKWAWNGPEIPASKPAYQMLSTGYDGRIWVFLHSHAEVLDPPEPAWDPSPGAPPPLLERYREPNVYDVFEPNGTYLGRVRLQRGQRILRTRDNNVWGIHTDSLGVVYVARWRVEPPFQTPPPLTRRPLN